MCRRGNRLLLVRPVDLEMSAKYSRLYTEKLLKIRDCRSSSSKSNESRIPLSPPPPPPKKKRLPAHLRISQQDNFGIWTLCLIVQHQLCQIPYAFRLGGFIRAQVSRVRRLGDIGSGTLGCDAQRNHIHGADALWSTAFAADDDVCRAAGGGGAV